MISRRDVLRAGLVIGAAYPLKGCETVISRVTERFGLDVPERLRFEANQGIDPCFHLLSRAAYGPWPGDIDRLKEMGEKNWIEEQLQPEKIDDKLCDMRSRRFETLELDPGTCYEFKRHALRNDLVRHALLKAVYSKRQLKEVMVGFWTDHLNINIEKGACMNLKAFDERAVVRKHALGKFKDLIRASALSPAMLVYLDGAQNKKEGAQGIPNENYARELLELHTLGVHGGYTQKDVLEIARCLTGFRLYEHWQRGKAYFDPKVHDDGEKIVLGHRVLAGGGEKDLDAVIDIVCRHPSTSQYIASKLVRHFVADDPPQPVVKRVARVFNTTGGDIKSMLRTIFASNEFQENKGTRLKRPFHYVVSCLRALAADTHAHDELTEYLTRMGHAPYQYPTPDGYPEEPGPWLGSLLWRWNFAFALTSNTIPSVNVSLSKLESAAGCAQSNRSVVEKLFPHCVGRLPDKTELAALKDQAKRLGASGDAQRAELIGLILASPAFQRC